MAVQTPRSRIKVTFELFMNNKKIAVNLVVSSRPQFFIAMIVSATNKHTKIQNINFEILVLKPKIHC